MGDGDRHQVISVREYVCVYVGETDKEALARELQEELQVRCSVGEYVGVGAVAISSALSLIYRCEIPVCNYLKRQKFLSFFYNTISL